MNLKVNLQERLYNNLPDLYQKEDSKYGYTLRKVLEVFGVGFNELEKYIYDLSMAYDLDNCPAKFLPLIAQFYGVEFPYSFDEATQRKFLKVIPLLYEHKGTDKAFRFLAREIFGQATVTNSWTPNRRDTDMTEEEWIASGEWKKLYVKAEVDGETYELDDKANQFIKFSEILRPVNTVLIPHLSFFYLEEYDRAGKVKSTYELDRLDCYDEVEIVKKAKITDLEKMKTSDAEVYNVPARVFDTNGFRLNLSLLNSKDTLSGWEDKTIIKHIPVTDYFNKIIYDVGELDTITAIDSDEYTTKIAEILVETLRDLSREVYNVSINGDFSLDTLKQNEGVDAKRFTGELDTYNLDTSKYLDEDTTSVVNMVDSYNTYKSRSVRFSHLGLTKLTTEFRTTDFISNLDLTLL